MESVGIENQAGDSFRGCYGIDVGVDYVADLSVKYECVTRVRLGSARVSRVGERVLAIANFRGSSHRSEQGHSMEKPVSA
jgi:hypothetical protein